MKMFFRLNCFKTGRANTLRVNFSTVNLSFLSRQRNVDLAKAQQNWDLCRYWINPRTSPRYNQLTGFNQSGDGKTRVLDVKAIGSLNFERYKRKVGIVMSRSEEVHVEEGLFGNRPIRVVTNSSSMVPEGLIDQRVQLSEKQRDSAVSVILVRDAELSTGLFTYHDAKTVLSNGSNVEDIKSALNKMLGN